MTLGTSGDQQHERVSLLLSLPGSLEQQFWVTPSTQAVLRVFDLIGCSFPLLNIFVAALRRIRAIPSDVQVPYGARIMLAVYLSIHLATLLLQLVRPDLYRTHRLNIIRLVRLCRLTFTVLLTHAGTVLGYVTQVAAVSKAALSGNIPRALAITTFAPTAMHLQHSNMHLPFKALVPFQLANYLVAIMWAKGMPCWLLPGSSRALTNLSTASTNPSTAQHTFPHFLAVGLAQASTSNSTCSMPGTAADVPAALQRAAERWCGRLRSLQLVLSLAVPVTPNFINTQHHMLCQGPSAYQLLYLYVAALLLLVLPLLGSYVLEWWAKSRWLSARGLTVARKSLLWPTAVAQQTSDAQAASTNLSYPVDHSYGVAAPCWLLGLPLLLLLLVQLPWVVAEALTSRMQGTCAPALGGPRFAWMSGLW